MTKLKRRTLFAATTVLSAVLALAGVDAQAQRSKDMVVLGMVLEPTGLDPTTGAAAAIGEIVHYNVLEGLTKISSAGSVTPLLASDWTSDPDGKSYTFKLRKGITFQDGSEFDASTALRTAVAANRVRRLSLVMKRLRLSGWSKRGQNVGRANAAADFAPAASTTSARWQATLWSSARRRSGGAWCRQMSWRQGQRTA